MGVRIMIDKEQTLNSRYLKLKRLNLIETCNRCTQNAIRVRKGSAKAYKTRLRQ